MRTSYGLQCEFGSGLAGSMSVGLFQPQPGKDILFHL